MAKEIVDFLEEGSSFEIIDFDKECESDIIRGKGFIVSEIAYHKVKKKNVKFKYGTHSPLFGSDWDDENNQGSDYKCACIEGGLRGIIHKGEVCPVCGEEVRLKGVDYNIFGWIVLEDHQYIHPLFYHFIETAVGKPNLEEMLMFDKETDINGNFNSKKPENVEPRTPFYKIGLVEFRKRFIEIMTYFKKKRKKYIDVIEFILANKEKVFTHCIPVCSPMLRPLMFKGEDLIYTKIDRKYNSIVRIAKRLNQSKTNLDNISIPYKLYTIQIKVQEIWEKIFCIINQKDGFIKDQVLGGRLNYTARNVIIPDPTLRIDQVVLGYKCFMELYKHELIAIVSRTRNITENEANSLWSNAMIRFSSVFYNAIQHILRTMDPCILLSRNPTINYGSILCMDIVDVTPKICSYAMILPIQILVGLNADFDGDVLNIISIKAKDLKKAFRRVYNPRDNMLISRDNGLYDSTHGLLKDQLIGLRDFNTI